MFSAKIVQVIETTVMRGRDVILQYWSLDGRLLWEVNKETTKDPVSETWEKIDEMISK